MTDTTIDDVYNMQLIYGGLCQPAYEGASLSYKNELRGIVTGGTNLVIAKELLLLQLRVAHAIRNNPYAFAAKEKYVTNLQAIKINWQKSNKKADTRMQDIWDNWVEDPCLDGYGNFDSFQSLVHSTMFQTGAVFIRKQIRKNSSPVSLKLELVPTEYLDVGFNTFGQTSDVRYGIEFIDSRPTNYYFRRGIVDSVYYGRDNPYDRVIIPADELIHVFQRTLPNQWLGIPLLAPALIALYEIDDLVDATVAKQKAAQAIAWIVKNTNPIAMTPVGVPVTKKVDGKDKIIFKGNGGNVQYLNKGEDISFYQSTDIGDNLMKLIRSELQKVAASLGIPFYQLTGDYEGIDYSTLRGLAIELRTRAEYIHHFIMIPLCLKPIAKYVQSLVSLTNSRLATSIPTFQLPRWYGVDELKDTQADLLEVQSGFATLQSKLDERHMTFEEIIEDRKRMKENGIDLAQPNQSLTTQSTNFKGNSNSSSL